MESASRSQKKNEFSWIRKGSKRNIERSGARRCPSRKLEEERREEVDTTDPVLHSLAVFLASSSSTEGRCSCWTGLVCLFVCSTDSCTVDVLLSLH